MKYTYGIMTKQNMVDVEGNTLQKKLHDLGYTDVSNVRVGKVVSFELPDSDPHTPQRICQRVLVNETYQEDKLLAVEVT